MYETTVFNTADEKTEFNSGMRLISKPRIYIPASIASCFKDISRQMTSEFSFFYKIKEQYGWDFFIDEKGFLPKQRVTGSHIEYDEPRPSFDFRCVIHRHPDGCHSFSKDDNDAINLNFDVSLIWTARDGFVRAQLNLLDDADCTQRMVIDADVWIITPQYVNKYMKKISALTYKQPEPKRIEQAKVLTCTR